MRRAHKVDDTQRELLADLRRFGFSVVDTSRLGDGFPDAVIGRQGMTALLEIKTPRGADGRYLISKGQKLFAQLWRGSPVIFGHRAEEVTAQFMRQAKLYKARLWPWEAVRVADTANVDHPSEASEVNARVSRGEGSGPRAQGGGEGAEGPPD